MADRLEIEHEGRKYYWTEKQGIIGADYVVPPRRLRATLEGKLASDIDRLDAQVTDFQVLLEKAIVAKRAGMLPRAHRLAERAVSMNPDHEGAVSLLSSVLRRRNRPEEALELTDRFATTRNSAVLTTRAAALADLGRLEEALSVAKRAWAISSDRGTPDAELRALFPRLESER